MKNLAKSYLLSFFILSGLSYAEVPVDIEDTFNKCRDNAENTVEYNECSAKRLKAYDAKLNEAYKSSLAKCSERENRIPCV